MNWHTENPAHNLRQRHTENPAHNLRQRHTDRESSSQSKAKAYGEFSSQSKAKAYAVTGPQAKQSGPKDPAELRCYFCGTKGHKANKCSTDRKTHKECNTSIIPSAGNPRGRQPQHPRHVQTPGPHIQRRQLKSSRHQWREKPPLRGSQPTWPGRNVQYCH